MSQLRQDTEILVLVGGLAGVVTTTAPIVAPLGTTAVF
jgi:hypothetical protein